MVLAIAEVLAIAAIAAWQWTQPPPAEVDLARLPHATAIDLQRLWKTARGPEPNGWRELGEAYLAYGYFVEAEVCLRHARSLNRDDFATLYAHALSLDRMGRTRDAHQSFDTAARLANPEMLRHCLYEMARNHLRDEQPVEAEQAFELIDGFPAADHQRARLLLFSGREAEAKPLIARLEQSHPNDVHVRLLAMRAAQIAGQSAEASEHADRSERSTAQIQLSDYIEQLHAIRSRYGVHAALARVEAANRAGQLTDAAVEFEAIVRDTELEFLLDELAIGAELELRAGRPQEALRLLQLLGNRLSLPPTALHLLADALHDIGQTDEARHIWERANQLRPRSKTHARLAKLYAADGDPMRATREQGLASQVAGINAFRQNQLDEALAQLESSVELAPSEARTWFYLGEVHRQRATTDLATEAFRRCVALDPQHGRALDRLAAIGK